MYVVTYVVSQMATRNKEEPLGKKSKFFKRTIVSHWCLKTRKISAIYLSERSRDHFIVHQFSLRREEVWSAKREHWKGGASSHDFYPHLCPQNWLWLLETNMIAIISVLGISFSSFLSLLVSFGCHFAVLMNTIRLTKRVFSVLYFHWSGL